MWAVPAEVAVIAAGEAHGAGGAVSGVVAIRAAVEAHGAVGVAWMSSSPSAKPLLPLDSRRRVDMRLPPKALLLRSRRGIVEIRLPPNIRMRVNITLPPPTRVLLPRSRLVVRRKCSRVRIHKWADGRVVQLYLDRRPPKSLRRHLWHRGQIARVCLVRLVLSSLWRRL